MFVLANERESACECALNQFLSAGAVSFCPWKSVQHCLGQITSVVCCTATVLTVEGCRPGFWMLHHSNSNSTVTVTVWLLQYGHMMSSLKNKALKIKGADGGERWIDRERKGGDTAGYICI